MLAKAWRVEVDKRMMHAFSASKVAGGLLPAFVCLPNCRVSLEHTKGGARDEQSQVIILNSMAGASVRSAGTKRDCSEEGTAAERGQRKLQAAP